MPKQVHKIEQFHGGINSSSDPRDVLDNESTALVDAMVDEVGTVRTIGSNVNQTDVATKYLDNIASLTGVPGAGLFVFKHDRTGAEDAGSAEAETGDEYIGFYADDNPGVWIYSLAEDDWNDDANSSNRPAIDFNGKTTGDAARPVFTSIDGALRISSGELSKWDATTDVNESLNATDTEITVDDGTQFTADSYIQIDDEIIYIVSIATHVLTVRRGMFGTKSVAHTDDSDIYILNMNQWYGYINNKFFQTSAGVPEYSPSKWYNNIGFLRSLDDLGITLALDDSSSASPDATALVENKIIVSYWLSDDGFWNGSYWIGLTPVYLGNQEGPISTVGSSPLQMSEQILNVQLHVCHPDVDSATIATHPLGDDRIIGLNLYVKSFTSDEWFLLKKFDLLEGGEHGWSQYAENETTTGFWSDGSASLANPASSDSYERTTAVLTVTPGAQMGSGRKGIARVSGFKVSPLYATVDLNSTSGQTTTLNVVNPGPSSQATFVIDVLDENYDVLYTTQVEKNISDSGAAEPDYTGGGGYGADQGGSS